MFKTTPILRIFDDDQWELAAPLIYVSVDLDVITVPEGFVTDLASIPQAFQGLISVNGRHRAPAILHDYLYSIRAFDGNRKRCDDLFLEAMASVGVRWSQRWAMYLAVRVGGWVAWDK
jgi:hypothetical protein